MFPQFWWWGKTALPELRWNLIAGIVLAIAAVAHRAISSERIEFPPAIRTLLILLAVNATAVHFVLAPSRAISEETYILLLKFTGLLLAITMCIRDRTDLRIAMWSMILGATYLGYEVTINDRGSLSGGRLEDIGAAGVANANQLASLIATILPLAGALFLTGSRREKVAAAIVAPFVLNVLLLCNSRGAFLATIGAGAVFVLSARGPALKKAKQGLVLGAVAVFLLLNDPDILERFSTVFVGSEERDRSAQSRLEFWSAAIEMISDHPIGSGGDGFSEVYGARYLNLGGDSRPIHNGYLTEAADWGIQALVLRLMLLGSAIAIAWRTVQARKRVDDPDGVILGACLLTAMAAYLGTSVFGDYIDEEWGYWMMALIVVYARLYASAVPVEAAVLQPTETLPSWRPPVTDARPVSRVPRTVGAGKEGPLS
jgi:O-antigen ligase